MRMMEAAGQADRGEHTTHIQVCPIDGEFWFLIRHGDTFSRKARIENRKWEILHFRPAKDVVVVYSPARDEIRVPAGTKGEREVYWKAFGLRLRGHFGFFSERKEYML